MRVSASGHRGAATDPNPTKAGYTFSGWDKAFDNITSNLDVFGTFLDVSIPSFTVKFFVDGELFSTQVINLGGAASDPNPTKVGHTFLGWDKAFDNITSDLEVFGTFAINLYTVTFVDGFGLILDVQTDIEHGGSAVAPEDPEKTGYIFTGWDKAFDNVTDNLTVTARWRTPGGGGGGSSGGGGGGGTPPPTPTPEPEIIEEDEAPIALEFVLDHIQYLYGYPEGDVRPENGISRA